MSRRHSTKSDMDDLDDVLGDLLGDDDPPKKASPKKSTTSKRNSVLDDDFYKNLAADVSESDISDADPNEILQGMDDMDDMDAMLFGKRPITPTRTSTPKTQQKDSFDDDPLADLLGDDSDLDFKPKPKPASPKRLPAKSEEKPSLGAAKSEEKHSRGSSAEAGSLPGSRRHEVERPPTRSGNNTSSGGTDARNSAADGMFGDDDILGMMGESPPAKIKAPETSGGASFLDSLMGSSSVSKHLEKPGAGARREFVLDKKYTKSEPVKKELTEDDFQFGGYMPSAVNTAGSSRPSSKRSVRFEDDDGPSRGSSSGGRMRGASPILDASQSKDPTDWLGIGDTGKEETHKPSEAVDWLGLSRLGSPAEGHNHSADIARNETDTKPRKSSLKSSQGKDDPLNWLDRDSEPMSSHGASEPKMTRKTEETSENKALDEHINSSSSKRGSAQDWLGDDLLNNSSSKRGSAQDWLGDDLLNNSSSKRGSAKDRPGEVEVNLNKSKENIPDSWLGPTIEPDTQPASVHRSGADERGLNLFSVPQRRESNTLPWDEPVRAGRQSPKSPKSTGDDSGNLDDTLAALKKQKAEKESQRAAAPIQADFTLVPAAQERTMQVQAPRQNESRVQQYPIQYKNQVVAGNVGSGFDDNKLKTLELENIHLRTLQDTLRAQHEEETQLLQDSFRKRIELIESSFSSREQRYQEENKLLSEQHTAQLRQAEQARAEVVSLHAQRIEDMQARHQEEMEQLRQQHRFIQEQMRNEHEEALERLKKAKQLEVEAMANTQSTSKSLHFVMERLTTSTQELEGLQNKVENSHSTVLEQRETAANFRDNQLKTLQERLERDHHENEKERARLHGLVTKLESQLTDQAQSMEEERWQLSQERNRLQSLQSALERDKEATRERMQREHAEIQQTREQLLSEQRNVLMQLQEERRQMVEERTELKIAQKLRGEQEYRGASKGHLNDAELESSIRLINNEKSRLAQQAEGLVSEREQLQGATNKLSEERKSLEQERQRMEDMALHLKQRSQEVQHMCDEAVSTKEAGEQALGDAKRLESEHNQRLQNLHAQIQALHNKEKQIALERLSLAKEKSMMDHLKDSFICVNCQTPSKDIPDNNVTKSAQKQPMTQSAAAVNLYASLDPSLREQITPLGQVSASIEVDRMVRHWRRTAQQDKAFLEEESMFLDALKHAPYTTQAFS